MSTTKLTGRENLTKCAFWLSPVEPTDKENRVKMYKSTVFVTLPLCNIKDRHPYQAVGSGSVSNWKAGSGSLSEWKAWSGSVSKGSGSATLNFTADYCGNNL
jgi:hypothetical protein